MEIIGSSRFQPGEGPSRGLLRDYEPSDVIRMQLFEALIQVHTNICTKTRAKKRKPYDVVKVNV